MKKKPMRCSVWRPSDHHTSSGALVSRCGRGIELQVRPLDLHRQASTDSFAFVVRHRGRVVRHGMAKGRAKAQAAARSQATSRGLP